MNPIYNTYTPEGFGNVNPYLFAEDPQQLIDFLKEAFYAEELSRTLRPENGTIANCVLKIGDSCFMIAQASEPFHGMRTALYFYTEAVDELYQRALVHGAQAVFPPGEQAFGDYQGGIEDPAGNYWWISRRLKEGGYEN
jgi:PhnB protein